ncbi:MAG TPA: hypothetical protein GXZ49_00730 [Bacteroidetes bacterium]|nr:hypothetical protein [Bacteroidota bacterium]
MNRLGERIGKERSELWSRPDELAEKAWTTPGKIEKPKICLSVFTLRLPTINNH